MEIGHMKGINVRGSGMLRGEVKPYHRNFDTDPKSLSGGEGYSQEGDGN